MTVLIVVAFQTVALTGVAAIWYRMGLRAGFARGENHGIHGVLRALREVMDDDDDGRRTH